MNNKRNSTWSACVLGALLGVTSANAFSLSVEGRWIEVHVLDKQTGNAVNEAAVCLGTTARPDQFGAMRSDKDGVVRFESLSQLPVAMLATVSKSGYQGRQQLLEPQPQNRILVLKVVSGGGGPQCDAPLARAEGDVASGLTIERITIKPDAAADNSGQVQVSVQVSGEANQIRISEQADFSGAPWQALVPAVAYSTSKGKGVKQIYVQVRRQAKAKGASIEVMSQPGKTTYRVR
ncbi:MAG: hypothetical protein BMS9Abin09_0276 [Gammaproteobacteria bacterium]|nr:MAG: hypothetical protein BMS9Abin09_0276 [Gammaproteobacteria bacterium]